MEPDSGVARQTCMRRPYLLLLVTLVAVTLLPGSGPASASCAGPTVDAPTRLVRGETAEVEGRFFVDGCRDTMSCPVGCGDCEYDDPPPTPQEHVTLQLTQRGRTWDLATADADDDGRVTWAFTVPDGVRPGPARLVWGTPDGLPVRVR